MFLAANHIMYCIFFMKLAKNIEDFLINQNHLFHFTAHGNIYFNHGFKRTHLIYW